MEHLKMTEKAIEMQKTFFDTTFDAVCAFQDEMEKVYRQAMDQVTWIPEEGKKTLMGWTDNYKKARAQFKTSVSDSYKRFQSLYAGKTN